MDSLNPRDAETQRSQGPQPKESTTEDTEDAEKKPPRHQGTKQRIKLDLKRCFTPSRKAAKTKKTQTPPLRLCLRFFKEIFSRKQEAMVLYDREATKIED